MATDVNAVRARLAAFLPAHRDSEIRLLGAGLDNVSYLAGDDLVIRLRTGDDPADLAAVRQEQRVLALAGRQRTVPVPEPLVAADGMIAYRRLPGTPLIGIPDDRRAGWAVALGEVLGRFLEGLHAIPAADVADPVEVDDDLLEDWLVEAQECYAATADLVPWQYLGPIERFLQSRVPPGADEMVFGHNDLGAEHVLVDPATGAVTGVIDFSDAGLADPAIDMGLLLRDLGPDGYRAAARHTGAHDPAAAHLRAEFFARWRTLEDLRFGSDRARPEYVANAVRAMEWLFPG